MEADATFVIGSSHEVCQDWAVAGRGSGRAWIVVCDGCSSSPSTDFGARLVGRAADHALASGRVLPGSIVASAAIHAQGLRLPRPCLDATLLCAWTDEAAVRVLACGDGVVAARRRDGRIESWCVEFPDSAPAYPSYLIDPPRLARYLGDHGLRRVVHRLDDEVIAVSRQHLRDEGPYALRWTLPTQTYDVVALFSDGASALRHPDRRPLPIAAGVGELLAFRRRRGRFVRRRLRGVLRRGGYQLGDDLSMAAIATPQLEEAA